MANLFNINILTREKTIYSGPTSSLVAPGELGYLGILSNHAPLVTTLVPGNIILKELSGQVVTFKSKGKGFLHVLKNDVTVLLDSLE